MANPLVEEALALNAAVNDAALLLCQRRRRRLELRLQQLRRQPQARQQGEEAQLTESLSRVNQALLAVGHMQQPLQQLPHDELEQELARLPGQLAAAEARMLAQLEPFIAVVARLAGVPLDVDIALVNPQAFSQLPAKDLLSLAGGVLNLARIEACRQDVESCLRAAEPWGTGWRRWGLLANICQLALCWPERALASAGLPPYSFWLRGTFRAIWWLLVGSLVQCRFMAGNAEHRSAAELVDAVSDRLFLAAAAALAAFVALNKTDIPQRPDDIATLRRHADATFQLQSPAGIALPRLHAMAFQVRRQLLRTVGQAERANDVVRCSRLR
ncbi:hypothetical protein COHA_005447 [Chlorella ohadii]|uniref:Uncharacterized protein n=1 Tax=Chlorella ohadii TaxID=2649997 RepID=A0AAD5DRW8_9CHLO|nr:hypothetical protein COHA_005447 [Chlorella ohadii]